MNAAGIVLFFVLTIVIILVGITIAWFGVVRFQREHVTHPSADKSTMFRCCGVDLLITLAGLGLTFFGALSTFRIILG